MSDGPTSTLDAREYLSVVANGSVLFLFLQHGTLAVSLKILPGPPSLSCSFLLDRKTCLTTGTISPLHTIFTKTLAKTKTTRTLLSDSDGCEGAPVRVRVGHAREKSARSGEVDSSSFVVTGVPYYCTEPPVG